MKDHTIRYFDKPGPACTAGVLEALRSRLAEAGPAHLVVASISGRTALKLARPLARQELNIVCVTGPPSWDIYPEYSQPRLQPAIKSDLERLGVPIVDRTPSSFSDTVEYSQARFGFAPPSWLIVETLVAVGGYGLKTAVEATLMATDAGAVPPFQEVLAVAGTNRGADTAVIVVSTFANCFFSLEPERRFQVKEILAMPRNKAWHETMTWGDWKVQERRPARRGRRRVSSEAV